MNHFSFDLNASPVWLPIVALAVGIAIAVWSYWHTVPQVSRGRRNILVVLRSLGLAALFFALLQPIFTLTKSHDLNPTVGLVLDASQSMQLPQSTSTSGNQATAETRRQAMIASVKQAIPSDFLLDRKKLSAFTVGDRTQALGLPTPAVIDSLHTQASVTDLSSIFQTVREARRTQGIEALVVYSDGSFTAGTNPVYSAQALGIPVYTIGLGDSTEPRDVALTELFTNEVGTIAVAQPVDVTLHYGGAQAGEQVRLEIFAENEKIGERVFALNSGSGDEAASFLFTPKTEGIVKLTARVSNLSGEATEKNNIRLAYVRVLKNKFRIAMFAGAPSPDVSFVKAHFESNPSIELSTFIQKQGAQFYEGDPTPDRLKDVDLVLLVGFPIHQTSEETMGIVRNLVINQSKPLLFIPSHTLDYAKLSEIQDVLPFRFDAQRAGTNEIKVSAYIDPTKAENPLLRIPVEEQAKMRWESLAPLFKSEAHFEPRPESDVVAEATIQGVRLGEPLMITRRVGNSRQIALTGYGLWQWRLTSFGRDQAYSAASRFRDTTKAELDPLDIFLSNSTRWLTTSDENKRVRIEPTRRFYEAGERIDLIGQVYDESFVPVERATVTIRIQGGGLKQPLDLTLEPISNGRYTASIPKGLPAGDYTYTGTAAKGGKTIGSDAGRFNVGDFNIEFAEPRMRSDILRAMAERTGGKFYTVATAQNLMKDLLQSAALKPKQVQDRSDYEIWNAWPLLLAALCFFSAEWFMRKRSGML